MKNDFILLEQLKVLQQKLSSTKVPNRKNLNESLLRNELINKILLFESSNGVIPDSQLTILNKPSGEKGESKLNSKAAIDFNNMVKAAKLDGVDIEVSQGYRALGSKERGCSDGFTQWCAWIKYKSGTGNLAAQPGSSNHGKGSAVDVKNCGKGGKVHTWLSKNASEFNFRPLASEDWHWDHSSSRESIISKTDNEKPKTIDTKLPPNVQKLIDKLKTSYGVNITQKHIDKEYEMEGDVRPDAGSVDSQAEKKIKELIKDCKKAHPNVNFPDSIVSGYRSYDKQVDNFGTKAKKRGIEDTQSANCLPGFTQHHTGKAFDIISVDVGWWNTNSDVKKWVADNCKNYGFEVTYTKPNKLRIPEPWHLFYISGGNTKNKISDENKSDENKSDENKSDENKSDENKTDNDSNDVTTTTTTEKSSFLDFFQNFGGIFNEELKIQEHMKNDFILLEHVKVLQQKLLSTDVPNRPKYLNESSLQIKNISGESKFKGKQFSPKYFVLHHTGGRGTPSDVIRILNCRHYNGSSKCTTLGIQWIIDRDGKLYQSLPKGSKGAHLKFQKDGMGHVTNSTSEGVEIIGLNDGDITIKQCKTALLLIKSLGHSLSNVYGHGDVSTNKQATEGKRCKTYVTKYWNTPEDQLPEVDDEVGVWVDQKDKKDKKDKKDQKDNVTTTTTTTDTSKSSTNDDNDNKTTPEKNGFLDFFKNFGGILKKEEVSKIQEDVQRIKNLLK